MEAMPRTQKEKGASLPVHEPFGESLRLMSMLRMFDALKNTSWGYGDLALCGARSLKERCYSNSKRVE